MQAIAKFVVKNEDFRAWLEAGMPNNVVFLKDCKKKKTAEKRPTTKKNNIVPFILPDSIA